MSVESKISTSLFTHRNHRAEEIDETDLVLFGGFLHRLKVGRDPQIIEITRLESRNVEAADGRKEHHLRGGLVVVGL